MFDIFTLNTECYPNLIFINVNHYTVYAIPMKIMKIIYYLFDTFT